MSGKPEPSARRSSVTDGNPAEGGDLAHARAGADTVRHLADSDLIDGDTLTDDTAVACIDLNGPAPARKAQAVPLSADRTSRS